MSHSEQPSRDGRDFPADWFPAILDSIPDPVIVVDGDLMVRACNDAAGALVVGDLAGRSLQELAVLADLIGVLQADAGGAENGHTLEIALGDSRVFAPHVSALRSAGGAIEGWVFVLRDISLVKRIHGSMSDFLGTVSHDLRSPLTFMRGYVDMLGMVGELNERQEGFAGKIADGITQMTDIVEKVLEAGKLDPETGNYQLVREATDLQGMVRQIAGEFAEAAARKRLDIHCSVADDVPVVPVDRAMLRSAFTNLVENAVKYTPDDGQIGIDLWREDRQLLFRVRDDGFGIQPEDQSRLFERHVRIHRKEWKRIKGSGLGLFIVRSVARRHGGDAWVESEAGAGSSFYVSIPLTGAPGP